MEKMNVYNLIILDASGSMGMIYKQALSGLNETIQSIQQTQKDCPELEQNLTLASFNAGENYLKTIYFGTPISRVEKITEQQYVPGGCTALYDAMGEMITRIQNVKQHDDRVLVTVITDGLENASQKWTASGIKSLVEELRQMGWTFTYIGANQDVVEEASKMGIRNTLAFQETAVGAAAMFAKERKSRRRYMEDIKFCLANSCSEMNRAEKDDFFDAD